MYEAKQSGKACVRVFDAAMQRRAAERLRLEEDLRRAIERDELTIQYQPIVDLEGGTVHAFEALCRWEHAELGPIGPDRFIPIAEDTGQIVALGERVLVSAARWLARWRRARPEEPGVRVQVNLLRHQLAADGLAEWIAGLVRGEGIEPADVVLETTEIAYVEDEDTLIRTLESLHGAGFVLSLDDFGAGYSTLSNLKRFPVDQVKIDRSFFSGAHEQRDVLALTREIVTLAGNRGFDAVAEGLESAEQVTVLRVVGCRYAQGFVFARPMGGDAALDWRWDEARLGLAA
ncbi:MAG: EAL domain-containing protein [Planctomycetota bacterium]